MRDRLIGLLRDTFNYTKGVCIEFDEAVEINADYLLANGVIVPPCKVGDAIYRVVEGKVIEDKAEKLEICRESNGELVFLVYYNWHGLGYEICTDKCFGKTVFLAREEAERALRATDHNVGDKGGDTE